MDSKRHSLTSARIVEGIWEGIYEGPATPNLTVTHLEQNVPGVTVEENGSGAWLVRVPIPSETLSEGVQTYLIQQDGKTLGSFSVAAGAVLGEDLRAEISLLRAELDMLKAAFRRHCLETMSKD